MNDAVVYFIVVLISTSFSLFNFLTLSIIFLNKCLRKRTSNLPIISFLIASAIQGLIAAPVYVYRLLEHDIHIPVWTCDVYRFPYLFCGHIMPMSLLLVSFDRMVAVRFPFKYETQAIPQYMAIALSSLWIITTIVDIIPFIHGSIGYDKRCTYVPSRFWGISVLVFYNLLPFVLIVVNYALIWSLAAKFAYHDKNRAESLRSQDCLFVSNSNNSNKQPLVLNKSTSYGSIAGRGRISVSRTLTNIKFLFEMRATKTSLILMAIYLICWGPLSTFYIMDHFCNGCLSSHNRNKTARIVIKILNFSSSLLAPIAYCWWNKDYRKTAKQILKKFLCRGCCCKSAAMKSDSRQRSSVSSSYRHSRVSINTIEETKMIS